MMFKNLTLYQIAPGWPDSAADLESAIQKEPFTTCSATQPRPHDPHHPYLRALVGCGHGRLFSEPCRECEIVKLQDEYRQAIKTVARTRNRLRALGVSLPGFTSR